jgi:hypothetical protein
LIALLIGAGQIDSVFEEAMDGVLGVDTSIK